jgi:uncharacterized phage infection (PIP) family protein YhgE
MWFSIRYSKEITKMIAKEEKEEMAASGNPMLHFKEMAEDVSMMRRNGLTKDELTPLLASVINAISQVCKTQMEAKDGICRGLESLEQKLAIIDQYIRNQDDILEKFANTFSDKLDNYFESSHAGFERQMKEHVTSEMTRCMDVLNLASRQLSENVKALASEHQAALGKVVADMNANITETTTSITSSMERTTQQLLQLGNDVQDASVQALETLNRETEFISNQVGQICMLYQQAQQGYTDTIMNIHDQNEQWEKALRQGSESLLSIRATQDHVNRLVADIGEQNEMLNKLRSGFNDLQKTIEQLQNMNSLLTKITSKL